MECSKWFSLILLMLVSCTINCFSKRSVTFTTIYMVKGCTRIIGCCFKMQKLQGLSKLETCYKFRSVLMQLKRYCVLLKDPTMSISKHQWTRRFYSQLWILLKNYQMRIKPNLVNSNTLSNYTNSWIFCFWKSDLTLLHTVALQNWMNYSHK